MQFGVGVLVNMLENVWRQMALVPNLANFVNNFWRLANIHLAHKCLLNTSCLLKDRA